MSTGESGVKASDDVSVPAPGTPCPRGCMLGWPRWKEPELLTVNEDGEVSCPTCWECFGIVYVGADPGQ